jgi:hypothetical protein
VTLPGLIIFNLLVGASVAFGARVQIRNLQRPLFYNRYFGSLVMLELFVLVPSGIYFTGFYPDWSWMYIVDTHWLPTGVNVMAIAACPIAATMGYVVGYFSARSKSDWVTVMFMGFTALGVLGLLVVGHDQIVHLGTYEQYHRNVGLNPIFATSLFPSLILAWLGAGVCWGYLLYRFGREGRLASPNL